MFAYLFGPSEPAPPPPPPPVTIQSGHPVIKRPAPERSPGLSLFGKKPRTFEASEALSRLKCGKDDDLVSAYDELLEVFDAEQARFAAAVQDLETRHEADMASLAESRDDAARRLTAKQSTFDESLKVLEVKLAALLRKRVETTYASKSEEASRVLADLDGEVRKKDLDLDALKKMYAELVARLEQQRGDHARHVAQAAHDALAQQTQAAEAQLAGVRAVQKQELDKLRGELNSLKDAERGTAADRDRPGRQTKMPSR